MTVEVAPRRPKTFRLPMGLVSALEDRAALEDVPQTEIVERALRTALGVAEEGPAAGPGHHGHGRAPAGAEGQSSPPNGAAAADDDQAAASGRPASPQLRDTDTVGLAGWLAGQTGMPHALCKRFVQQGRVKVGGKTCKDAIVARGRLADVQLDGEPVCQ